MRKTIHFAPMYQVDEQGNVFAIGTNWRGYGERLLVQAPNLDGYMQVRLITLRGRKPYQVHRLVALLFIGPKPTPRHEVRHLDGNRQNNRASNLAWGTRKENAADREAHGHTYSGERHHSSKLTENDVRCIVSAPRIRGIAPLLAAQYGVTPQAIYAVRNGRTWKRISRKDNSNE